MNARRIPRIPLAVLLAAALVTTPAVAALAPMHASQIPNLDTVKEEIVAYYASGNYEREVAGVDASAQSFVDAQLRHHPRKPAIVLDIDDTALSDYAYEAAHDFGYDPRPYDAAMDAESFAPILPTVRLAQHVAAEGVAIFFVTGRRTAARVPTLGNLAKAGYPHSAGLFLRPASDHARSVIPFKSHARAQIEAEGYTVLATIGDQWSDLRGGYAERAFKLPNPMYFVP